MQAPLNDATEILKSRFPCPKFVECDSGGSQARYLIAVLDPAETHNSQQPQFGMQAAGRQGSDIVFTEDVPLSVFLDHLYKKAATFEG